MRMRYLVTAALVSMSLQASAQEAAPAQTLDIKFEVTNGGELVASPRLLVTAGETFSVDVGAKYRYDVAKGSIGTQIKCKPVLQPENSLALDCNFRTTDVDGENTRTKSWQAKILVANGKPAAMWFGDKPGSEADKQSGLGINILADWRNAS